MNSSPSMGNQRKGREAGGCRSWRQAGDLLPSPPRGEGSIFLPLALPQRYFHVEVPLLASAVSHAGSSTSTRCGEACPRRFLPQKTVNPSISSASRRRSEGG